MKPLIVDDDPDDRERIVQLQKEYEEALRQWGLSEERYRVRTHQQAVVNKPGQHVLAGADLSNVMNEAVALVAQALEVEYCKVLELLPEDNALLLRAGVGWKEGCVGHATVDAGTDSQAGYTLLSRGPVILEDPHTETRFSLPPLLRNHGVVSGMSVIIQDREQPFGVLGAHTTQRRTFTQDDIHFLQAVANVLAAAVERRQAEEMLRYREELFRSMIENASDIITVLEVDGTIHYQCPAVERLLGYRPEELVDRSAFEYIHPDDALKGAETLAHMAQNPGIPQSVEWRARSGRPSRT